jgi:hypothetical protein
VEAARVVLQPHPTTNDHCSMINASLARYSPRHRAALSGTGEKELTGDVLAMADGNPDALWKLYGFDSMSREGWLRHAHQDLKFCDLPDGSCLLMCIASDSHAIWLGKFPNRGKAIHAVMCFCLQVGEFNPAHFEAEARADQSAVLTKLKPPPEELAFT